MWNILNLSLCSRHHQHPQHLSHHLHPFNPWGNLLYIKQKSLSLTPCIVVYQICLYLRVVPMITLMVLKKIFLNHYRIILRIITITVIRNKWRRSIWIRIRFKPTMCRQIVWWHYVQTPIVKLIHYNRLRTIIPNVLYCLKRCKQVTNQIEANSTEINTMKYLFEKKSSFFSVMIKDIYFLLSVRFLSW